eukprot:TRINITY_DN60137_c0_g1_i1.p1 TRINITY_DN60137_c0_g1~~TRINITY_DN60137_c0_g1_i1.p1  ORF type:complete len:639 (+),score=214.76 TRINITY_DN60137_c0_g1_i1:88-1917(+)
MLGAVLGGLRAGKPDRAMEMRVAMREALALTQENRRLQAEIDALRKQGPRRPGAFHRAECLRSVNFACRRGRPARQAEGLADGVSTEYFVAHEHDRAPNLQEDIEQAFRLHELESERLQSAQMGLQNAREGVQESALKTCRDVAAAYGRHTDAMKVKHQEFNAVLEEHRAGELAKIEKERVVARKLISVLNDLCFSIQGMIDEDSAAPTAEYKSLQRIKADFIAFRNVLIPPENPDELDEEPVAPGSPHTPGALRKLMTPLMQTLGAAREKAEGALTALGLCMKQVEDLVLDTLEEMSDQFAGLREAVDARVAICKKKTEVYRALYTARIDEERSRLDEVAGWLQKCKDLANNALSENNDYLLLEARNAYQDALIKAGAVAPMLGYDSITVTSCDDADLLSVPLSEVCYLKREDIPVHYSWNYLHFFQTELVNYLPRRGRSNSVFGPAGGGCAPDAPPRRPSRRFSGWITDEGVVSTRGAAVLARLFSAELFQRETGPPTTPQQHQRHRAPSVEPPDPSARRRTEAASDAHPAAVAARLAAGAEAASGRESSAWSPGPTTVATGPSPDPDEQAAARQRPASAPAHPAPPRVPLQHKRPHSSQKRLSVGD